MSAQHNAPMFLGRRLNPLTMCYGEIPAEVAQGIEDLAELLRGQQGQGLAVLAAIDAAKTTESKA